MPTAPTKKTLMMRIDPRTAATLEELSKATNSSTQEILDMLVFIGRKAVGREVKIISEEESSVFTISLAKFKKIAQLDLESEPAK